MDARRKTFYGRDRVLFEMTQGVLAPQPQSFSLVGPKLIGKSQLAPVSWPPKMARSWATTLAGQRPLAFEDGTRVVVIWVDCDWQDAQQDLIGWIYRQVQRHVREAGIGLELGSHRSRGHRPAGASGASPARSASRTCAWCCCMDNFDRVFEEQWVRRDTVDELRPLTLEMALRRRHRTAAARPRPRAGGVAALQRHDPALPGAARPAGRAQLDSLLCRRVQRRGGSGRRAGRPDGHAPLPAAPPGRHPDRGARDGRSAAGRWGRSTCPCCACAWPNMAACSSRRRTAGCNVCRRASAPRASASWWRPCWRAPFP